MNNWATSLYSLYNRAYNNSHGGTRVALSHVPIFGWAKRFEDEIQKAEDYYQNTGEDARYMSRYGGSAGASMLGAVGGAVLPRMARTLSKLYPAEVKESVNWNKAIQYQKMKAHNLERESMLNDSRLKLADTIGNNAQKWQKAWETKYKD